MKKATFAIVSGLLLSLCACSRVSQIESLNTRPNQNALIVSLKEGARKLTQAPLQGQKISVAYVLREEDQFSRSSPSSPLGKLLDTKLRDRYPFRPDVLSEHQKTMIDTFISDSVLSDPVLTLGSEGTRNDLLIVAYMRSYSRNRMLFFDIFDFGSGEQVARVQYEMSKITYEFEQKGSQ